MTFWHFPITTQILITVDRIEGDYAIVEWEDLALSSLHLSMIPFVANEGMKLQISLYPTPFGNTYAINEDPGILHGEYPLLIPMPDIVFAGLHYQYHIKEIPWMEPQ